MIQLTMTPMQFQEARAALKTSTQVLSYSESGPQSGNFATAQVAMSYSYDGAATLNLSITAKHGLAEFASEDRIKRTLVMLLAQV